MTKKEILLKQRNAENAPLTNYIGTDGYVWKMIENAMEEYHQDKLKLLGIADVSERYSLEDVRKYEDGWWITRWSEHRKDRLKLIGPFKTKQLAKNEREILNAR